MWLRYPRVITCSGSSLLIYLIQGIDSVLTHDISLAEYEARCHQAGRANTGRGANVVHGCDVRDGRVACGLASGHVLAMDLEADASGAPPPMTEMSGHSNVVGFIRLAAGAKRMVTSSFDKSARLWSLPDGECLQIIKTGTPVLQLALLPAATTAEADAPHVLIGCGDGTVRLWDSSCRKANKALTTLRFAHKMYVGELQLAADGSRMLSCSRDGALQLWKRGAKGSFVPDEESLPPKNLMSEYWRIELLPAGLAGITERGAVHWFGWGGGAPRELSASLPLLPLLESPAESYAEKLTAEAAAEAAVAAAMAKVGAPAAAPAAAAVDPPAGGAVMTAAGAVTGAADAITAAASVPSVLLAWVGLRPTGAGGAVATEGVNKTSLHVHLLYCDPPTAPALSAPVASAPKPADAQPVPTPVPPPVAPAALPAGWARWCEMAAAEGVSVDAALQQRLCMMEAVAAKAGRELGEASVHAFLQRQAQTKPND